MRQLSWNINTYYENICKTTPHGHSNSTQIKDTMFTVSSTCSLCLVAAILQPMASNMSCLKLVWNNPIFLYRSGNRLLLLLIKLMDMLKNISGYTVMRYT